MLLMLTQRNKVCQVYLSLLAYGKIRNLLHATLLSIPSVASFVKCFCRKIVNSTEFVQIVAILHKFVKCFFDESVFCGS